MEIKISLVVTQYLSNGMIDKKGYFATHVKHNFIERYVKRITFHS